MNAEGGFNFLAALNRRRALARLGLGVAVVYVAPAAFKLSEASAASGFSGALGAGNGAGSDFATGPSAGSSTSG